LVPKGDGGKDVAEEALQNDVIEFKATHPFIRQENREISITQHKNDTANLV